MKGEPTMKKLRHTLTAGIGAVLVLYTVSASAALNAYMTLKGQKQGQFKGSVQRATAAQTEPGAETVVAFTHGRTKPRDLNAATLDGKRASEPVVVTLKLDSASRPAWDAVAASHEIIPSATIKLFKAPTPGAPESLYETVNLANAIAEKVTVVSRDPSDTSPKTSDEVYLQVTLSFTKINVTYTTGGVTAADDWTASL
jgi:type VI secretion system secreted protein Hcp